MRAARQFTRRTLGEWHMEERFDDVALIVSELVTNALRHGLHHPRQHTAGESLWSTSVNGVGSSRDEESPVRLHLMRWTSRLVCAVRDPSTDSPVASDDAEVADFSAESGRGLFLVESFADSWGWHPLAGALGGKVVWALFRLAPDRI